MAPIFFDYPFRGDLGKQKVEFALKTFETYLKGTKTKYVTGDNLTIADIALVAGTVPLEGIGFSFAHYPLVQAWYDTFKREQPDLWSIAQGVVDEVADLEKNPPDLSKLNHPFHPKRKQ